jgi:hypothetical protein
MMTVTPVDTGPNRLVPGARFSTRMRIFGSPYQLTLEDQDR